MFLVYNSDILSDETFRVPLTDRAFQYGDGLFETIRYENGQIWFWRDHIERLSAGMAALQLHPPIDFSAETLHQRVQELLLANDLTDQCARIKIQVWRQSGGLYTPATNAANLLITVRSGQPFAVTESTKIGIYEAIRLVYSPISEYKLLNALPYVLAGLYKQANGFADTILLDTQGHLAECIASNLFWLKEGTLYTPSVVSGCVNGILRRQLLRLAHDLSIPVHEGLYGTAQLGAAEAVFCANVNGIQWLRAIQAIGDYPATHPLAEALFNALLSNH